jgi:Ca2+-binding RTX toxin-like protein
MTGGTGNDTMDGGGNNDTVSGNGGNDVLSGAAGVDNISGGGGNDTIDGGDGNDILAGGNNADRITGGLGADILSGNAGSDRFIYTDIAQSTLAVGGRDTITDFNEFAADRLDLSAIDAIAGGVDNAFVFVGAGGFTGLGQVRAYQSGADTFVDMNTTGTNAPDMRIVLTGVNVLDVLDFIL